MVDVTVYGRLETGRLHADDAFAADLTAVLAPSETSVVDCLAGDVAALRVRPDVTAGIDAGTLAWFESEAHALTAEASRVLGGAPATAPIHGDPWSANVLVHGDQWHLLDWDGLRLGDPAADYAMAIFENWVHGADAESRLPPDPDLRARVRFLLRAASFDAIVDPLADLTAMPAGVPGPHGSTRRSAASRWRCSGDTAGYSGGDTIGSRGSAVRAEPISRTATAVARRVSSRSAGRASRSLSRLGRPAPGSMRHRRRSPDPPASAVTLLSRFRATWVTARADLAPVGSGATSGGP